MKKLIIIILLALPFLMSAQSLTLDECRELAIRNNVKMRVANNAVREAEEDKKEAFTSFFPSVSGTFNWFNARKGLISMDMAGAEMSLLKNGYLGGITAMQPIFAGGQIVNGNRLAQIGVDVSRQQVRLSENEITETVEQYFWQVVNLREKLRTIASVDTLLMHVEADVQVAVDAGVSRRNDLLQVQLRRNELQANRYNLENTLALCRNLLAQYIGMDGQQVDVKTEIEIGVLPPSPESFIIDHYGAIDLLPEARLLDMNVKADELKVKMAVGQNLPSVAIGGGWLVDNLMDKSNGNLMVMATVSVPLSGWWGGGHKIRKSKIALASAQEQREDSRQLLLIRMHDAANNLRNSYNLLGVAKLSIEQSTENLRLNRDFYDAGTGTMTNLLDAQQIFQQSRDSYIEAWCNYCLDQRKYLIATGR